MPYQVPITILMTANAQYVKEGAPPNYTCKVRKNELSVVTKNIHVFAIYFGTSNAL